MNKYVKITSYVVILTVVALIVYDFFIIEAGGKDASISQVLIDYFYAYPVGSFAFGLVTGHLVWRMPNRYKITKDEYQIILKHREKK